MCIVMITLNDQKCWFDQDWRLEKKSSNNILDDDTNSGKVNSMSDNVDEEVPLMASSRLSHIGRSQLSSREA